LKRLIVGLGNPGKKYDGTRHNVGFAALDLFAKKHQLLFRKKEAWKGAVAESEIGGQSVILLKPMTYMNLSGESVRLVAEYLEIGLSQLLIVVDDVAIPLEQLRLRVNSGPGGHNGLKSIEECLQTNEYARLRIGVGDRMSGDLTEHVLGQFSEEESKLLPGVLERAVRAIELWLEKGLTSAMDFANCPSTPGIGDKE
jgi:PTH1 family peptidyl-tRNA hydrolase